MMMSAILNILDCLPLFRVLEALEHRLVSMLRRASSFAKGALVVFLFTALVLTLVLPFASTSEWSIGGVQRICKGRFVRAWSSAELAMAAPREVEMNENRQYEMFPSHTWNLLSVAASLVGFVVWLLASPHQSAVAGALDVKRTATTFLLPLT
jgi:hypothetical protein